MNQYRWINAALTIRLNGKTYDMSQVAGATFMAKVLVQETATGITAQVEGFTPVNLHPL